MRDKDTPVNFCPNCGTHYTGSNHPVCHSTTTQRPGRPA